MRAFFIATVRGLPPLWTPERGSQARYYFTPGAEWYKLKLLTPGGSSKSKYYFRELADVMGDNVQQSGKARRAHNPPYQPKPRKRLFLLIAFALQGAKL